MLASEILRVVFGFVVVLGMIGLAAYAAQKAGLSTMNGVTGRKKRLSLREVLPLDARRRVAIIKCDDTEYLIMLGPQGETVIDKELKPSVEHAETEDQLQNALAGPLGNIASFASKIRATGKHAA
ncbi:flagellar biosynthetic protein FliO [Hyphococcus sp. DH-69]|uniref:flagellar biosynthetic protein FliO n=1 Tax=Hyphococcus formosus TaxID=3143534 RepID=UPI00398A6CF6